jgi:phosphate:Na+ symporter
MSYLSREELLQRSSQELATQLAEARALIGVGAEADLLPLMKDVSQQVAATRRQQRVEVLNQTAAGKFDSEQAMAELEAMRWVDRLAYHAWRAINHLQENPSADAVDGEVIA